MYVYLVCMQLFPEGLLYVNKYSYLGNAQTQEEDCTAQTVIIRNYCSGEEEERAGMPWSRKEVA